MEKYIGKITLIIVLVVSMMFMIGMGVKASLPIVGAIFAFGAIGYTMHYLVLKYLRKKL